jgi:hypothetical protein
MKTYDARRPSKKLTAKLEEYVSNEEQRRETAKTAKELEETRDILRERILCYVDQGYAPTPGSPNGVIVREQSGRVAYEKLYRKLEKVLGKKYPRFAEEIKATAARIERQEIQELETKRVVVCGDNSELEKIVKNAEKAELEDRKTKREIELVIYT